MEIQTFDIQGPILIHLKAFHDNRGFFVERFNKSEIEKIGIKSEFVQDNFSRSDFGVLRGLHYQFDPPQGKLVSCTRGEIFDVAVDIRKNSPTFGHHISINLKSEHPSLFWIPAGFAHGFCVISNEGADLLYKVDKYWKSAGEGCLVWNDEQLAINWPLKTPILSDKDKKGINLSSYANKF